MSGSTLSDMWQSWLQIIATYETNVWWIQLGPSLMAEPWKPLMTSAP